MRVGIPEALLYHKFSSVWACFFKELGVEIIYSGNSSRKHLHNGVKFAHSDNCLPVKLAYGHVMELIDKCDYIFIPKIVRMEKNGYSCPKMIGFSDMIRNNLNIKSDKIIDISFDFNFSKIEFYFIKIAFKFTKNIGKIYSAIKVVKRELKIINSDKLNIIDDGNKLKIGLVGHPYNIFDPFINMNIVEDLNESGCSVLTSKNIPPKYNKGMFKEFPGNLFWSFGREIYSVSKRMIDNKLVDGIIYLIPFSCGLDSVLMGIVEDMAQNSNIPFMPLYVDEHTAKAAFTTRLEAFVDMLAMT